MTPPPQLRIAVLPDAERHACVALGYTSVENLRDDGANEALDEVMRVAAALRGAFAMGFDAGCVATRELASRPLIPSGGAS